MPDEKTPTDEVAAATTIDSLLATSGQFAMTSFAEQVKLGQNALRRLADPASVSTSAADDFQKAIGLMTSQALFATATLTRFFALATKQDS